MQHRGSLPIHALLLILAFISVSPSALSTTLADIANSSHRTATFKLRDPYRHPVKTLEFMGIEPNMAVAEIWPSTGWYAEILAPYLRDDGKYYAVSFSLTAKRTPQWRKNLTKQLIEKFNASPSLYDRTTVSSLAIPEDINIAPAGSLDLVLSFRNTHNWIRGDYTEAVFKAIHKALKPGGVLGLVQHRAASFTSIEDIKTTGYIAESYIIELAQQAGFVLEASSEINANPKDTKDHPKGVWTLPPSLRLGDVDKKKYLAIGESDRMTLKFKKPENSDGQSTTQLQVE